MPCGFLFLKVSDIRNNGGNVDLQEYINSFGKKKVPADIQERWQTRIVTRGLAEQGAAGAQQYLADYGKSIGAPKVAMLALQAQNMGFPEMAMAFWKKAYTLQFGAVPVDAAVPGAAQPVVAKTDVKPDLACFPEHLQPGRIVTMQPSDASYDRGEYVADPHYWGQPKRDGNKVVVFATANDCFYQSRSMKLRQTPSLEFEAALKAYAS